MSVIKIISILLRAAGCSANFATSTSTGDLMEISTATQFEGVVFHSILAAYEDFAEFGYDIANFAVDIDVSKDVKVTFIPKHHPNEGHILGGKTKFGREVSYIMDKSTGNLIKKIFAR
jgi:hypothetical protein